VLVFAPVPIEFRLLGCLVLFVVLPGLLSVELLLPDSGTENRDLPERFLLALGLGYCVALLLGAILTVLAVLGLTRSVQSWHATAVANALIIALLSLVFVGRSGSRPRYSRPGWPLLAIVGLAGVLRLWDLGWSELQGDEARILLRVMAAIQGVPDALLAHRKVPGEILVALPFYAQLGGMTELVARLPFALAGVGGVAAFFMLARELLGARAAVVAGFLLAVNGYFVGFGRILQYDSLAFLLGTLALLCCVRFGRGEQPQVGLALTGSTLLCGAGLMALGAVFFVLPAACIIGARFADSKRNRVRLLALWLWPGAVAAMCVLIVLAFEVIGHRPGGVLSYLGPRLGESRPYSNWPQLLTSANHYLSTPYLALTLGSGVVVVLSIVGTRLRDGSGRMMLFAVGLTLLTATVSWARPAAAALAAAVVALAIVMTSPARPLTFRAVILWAAAPLLVHGFLVRVPGTHWREAFPGLILLTASLLVASIPAGPIRRLSYGFGVLFTIALTSFAWVTLVQRWPEYQMTYPDQRHWLDWTGANGRGIGGVFGISHHHGWKTLAILQQRGTLPRSYVTNESPAIAAWYLRLPQGCPLPAELVIRTPRPPQDRNLILPVPLPIGYVNAGGLSLQGHATVSLQVDPASPTRFGTTQADAFAAEFDQTMTSPWRPIGAFYQPDLGAAASRADCVDGRE
jgi:4-amino-4-deoxy-L-arabinose transferase-like glycosyltransferase